VGTGDTPRFDITCFGFEPAGMDVAEQGNDMIRSTGLRIGDFFIPPFDVEKGELLVIELPPGCYFGAMLFKMADILTGKEVNYNVVLKERFRFVEHIASGGFIDRIFPTTVQGYIVKHSSPNGQAEEIYELFRANLPPESREIRPDTQVMKLSETSRRLLSLFTVCSWTDKIIFDLWGVGAGGGEHIYPIAKTLVAKSGTAVLIDYIDEYKNDCSGFVRYEVVGK